MNKILLFVFLYLSIIKPSNAISVKDSSLIFFPKNRIFPSVFLDPLECQISGGSYLLSRKGNNESLYSLVNFGFTKPIVVKNGKSTLWELNFGAATFTQFDLTRKDNGSYLAGLLNNDYKLSGDISIQKNKNVFRFRLFHVSSHLGDDYMLRHNDTLPNDKSDNYEQADLTYLRLVSNGYWYAGIGEVYTKYVFRERLSVNGGGLWNFGKSKPINLFTSINIKIFAENKFNPDIRTALGVNFNRNSESLVRIWLEYYSGQLPYSTLKYGRINWIGLAMWINLI